MSVLIKGMKMPEHCGYCRFRYDGICHALQKTKYQKEECPLVEVPTPHGDLVDRNEIRRLGNTACGNVFSAPTVIEAEE